MSKPSLLLIHTCGFYASDLSKHPYSFGLPLMFVSLPPPTLFWILSYLANKWSHSDYYEINPIGLWIYHFSFCGYWPRAYEIHWVLRENDEVIFLTAHPPHLFHNNLNNNRKEVAFIWRSFLLSSPIKLHTFGCTYQETEEVKQEGSIRSPYCPHFFKNSFPPKGYCVQGILYRPFALPLSETVSFSGIFLNALAWHRNKCVCLV